MFPDEASIRFGGVTFERTESGRYVNRNGKVLSDDALAMSKTLITTRLNMLFSPTLPAKNIKRIVLSNTNSRTSYY